MEKVLRNTVFILIGALIGSAIVYGTAKVDRGTVCHDALIYDTTEDGTPRVTYIGAEDTCKKGE